MKMLSFYLQPLRWKIISGLLIKALGALMVLLLPYMLEYTIDSIIPTKNTAFIILAGFIMIIFSCGGWFFDVRANRNASKIAMIVTQNLRHDLFVKTLNLSNNALDELTIPSLETRLTSDTYNIHQMVGMIQRMGVRAPILLLGGIIMTYLMEPVLSLVMLATLPMIAILIYLRATKGIPLYTIVQKAQDKMVSVVRENAQGVRVIKALSKQEDEEKRYQKVNADLANQEKAAAAKMAIINPAINLFINVGLVVVIAIDAIRVSQGLSETGKIIAFTNYFTLISTAMMSISRIFIMVSKGIASAKRIEQVMNVSDDIKIASPTASKPSDYAIEFDHVCFSYKGKVDNIHDFSFKLKAKETLGIIGVTGSGKSTIIQLLLRFYDIDQGIIKLNGKDIKEFQLKKLRSHFGTVMQNDFIFQGSIKENIAFGQDISSAMIEDAAQAAQADFIFDLPKQFEHQLNTKGTNLSGGQRQRILLARAFSQDPQILLLDDASSALDYATDARLRQAIDKHYHDKTKIIVTQRISSIMHADQIIVIDEGQIIAQGTHEELLKICKLYRDINDSQLGGALFE